MSIAGVKDKLPHTVVAGDDIELKTERYFVVLVNRGFHRSADVTEHGTAVYRPVNVSVLWEPAPLPTQPKKVSPTVTFGGTRVRAHAEGPDFGGYINVEIGGIRGTMLPRVKAYGRGELGSTEIILEVCDPELREAIAKAFNTKAGRKNVYIEGERPILRGLVEELREKLSERGSSSAELL